MKQEQIKFVETQRALGLTWDEAAEVYTNEYNDKVTGNALRKRYKLATLPEEYNNDPVDTLLKQRRSQLSANEARKKLRKSLDAQNKLSDIMSELHKIAKTIPKLPKVTVKPKNTKKTKMTIEALLGDVQVGKIMDDYNSEICKKRFIEYTSSLMLKIEQHQKQGYQVERIVLAMLGDMIEHSEKHHNSARGTDCSTPEQIRLVTEYLYQLVLVPLSKLGIPIEVKCVTGNHENRHGGLQMYYPGREHDSWIFYNFLKLICKETKLDHVTFDIAEGAFLTYDIYGHTVAIEHGVGIQATEASMSAKVQRRANQLKKHISFFRMGDKHHVARFNNDQYVINGAFFGSDVKGVEFSGILGYHSAAAQVVFCYVPRNKNDVRTPLYDSFVIQLQHVK